ncbi:MAG: heparinase II/III family protein, partial [Clostridia bacterium]
IVTAEGVPRGITVGFQNDPNAYTCAACGKDLRAFAGSYPWISDPLNKPWKIQCPSCRRYFPSNDFEGFYKLGLQPNGTFDVKAAHTKNDELIAAGKTGFLKNIENPDWDNQFNTKDWGVDDGFGYKTGVVFPNRVVESKTWIAYYNHWGLWYPNGKNNVAAIYSGVKTLSEAYLYTGDARYGRVGAILLDRVADVYPEYNLLPYFGTFYNSHGGTGEGKTIGRIWETESAKVFALAYDIFYPMYDDPQVVDFLNNKAISAGLVNKKETPSAIRKNCEDGILRATFEGCKDASIWGNFGSHQETLATAAVVLDTMPETKEWIDWTMQAGGINGHTVSGGNVLAQIVDQVNRDGHGMEAAPSYNKIWITGIVQIAEVLKDYKGYAGANLYDNPKVGQMVKSLTAITEGSNATVAYGDSGATAQIGLYAPRTEMLAAYQSTKDPEMAQILYWLADGKVDTLHGDICMKDPESIQKDIADTVEQYGETDLLKKSLNQAGNGFAILRDGEYIKSNTATETINTQQDFWMYYGRNLGHGHPDTLNLGMAAFGINMAPELGYPEATGSDPNRAQWINNTISHNTVVVNEQKQTNIPDAAKPLHFDDAGQVKLMDVDSPSSYKGTTDIYRRTVVSVKADPTTSYSVDFFRIKGGDDHTYSFHSQSKEIFETEGLKFKEQKDASGEWVGTYAGADVAWGANSKYMNGYSWLKKVRRADKPGTGEFAVDFKITDFRTVLPYPQDLHLRMTMLNDFDLNEVSIVEGTPPRLKGNPD